MAVVDRMNATLRRSSLIASDAVLGFGRNAATGFDAAARSATRTMTIIRREYDATHRKLAQGLNVRSTGIFGPGGGASGGEGGGGGIGLGGGAAAAAGGGAAGFAARAIAGPAAVGGIASLGTAAIGISAAASTQQSIAQLAVQNGRSIDFVNRNFGMLAMKASDRLGMSLNDVFSVIRETAGVIKSPQELKVSLLGVGKSGGILDLVKVLQSQGIGTSPEDTARNVIRVDHILNAYRGPQMAAVNEKLYRAAVGSHMPLDPLVAQVGYYGEMFRLASGNRKAAADDILNLAELGTWGVGKGKWGAGFGQIMGSILNPSKKAIPGLERLGVLDAHANPSRFTMNAQGEFTPMAMIDEVRRQMHTSGLGALQQQEMLRNGFRTQNAWRIMSEATSDKTRSFIDRLNASQKNMPSLMVAEGMLMNNLNDQTGRVTKSFQNLANLIEGPTAKKLAGVAQHTASKIDSTTTWLSTHPQARDLTANAVNAAAIGTAAWLAKSGMNLIGIGVNASKGEGFRLHTYFSKIFSRGGLVKDAQSMFDLVTKSAEKATPRAAGLAGKVGSAGEAALRSAGYFGTVFRVLARFNEISLPLMGIMDSYTFVQGVIKDQQASAKAIAGYQAAHGGQSPMQNAGGSGFGGVGGRPFEPRPLLHHYHRERTREVRHGDVHIHNSPTIVLPAGTPAQHAREIDRILRKKEEERASALRSQLRHVGDLPHDPSGFSVYEALAPAI